MLKKIKRKEFKHVTNESHQTTKEDSKRRKREELQKQPENNEQNGNKAIPINNYFKCKQTKFSNQKTQNGWLDYKNKTHVYAAYNRLISYIKTHRLKVEGQKKLSHSNENQKKAGVPILISEKKPRF